MAERFDADLYSRGIYKYEELVKIVKAEQFPEFRRQYYYLMSKP